MQNWIDYLSSDLPCNRLLFLDSTSAHNKDLNNYTLKSFAILNQSSNRRLMFKDPEEGKV